MYRHIEQDLIDWKQQYPRKPLLIRGARQVGKSYIVEKFAKTYFTVKCQLELPVATTRIAGVVQNFLLFYFQFFIFEPVTLTRNI